MALVTRALRSAYRLYGVFFQFEVVSELIALNDLAASHSTLRQTSFKVVLRMRRPCYLGQAAGQYESDNILLLSLIRVHGCTFRFVIAHERILKEVTTLITRSFAKYFTTASGQH